MSGTPVRKPRCSKCYAKRKAWEFVRIDSADFVEPAPMGAIFKCCICGHVWHSRSIAARRIADKYLREQGIMTATGVQGFAAREGEGA